MSVLAEKVIGKVYYKKTRTSLICQDQAMQFFAKFHILVILKKFRTSVTYYTTYLTTYCTSTCKPKTAYC